jgi:hypothetical protein
VYTNKKMRLVPLNYRSAFAGQIETRSKLLLAVKRNLLGQELLHYRVHYTNTATKLCFHGALTPILEALVVEELNDNT